LSEDLIAFYCVLIKEWRCVEKHRVFILLILKMMNKSFGRKVRDKKCIGV